MKEWFLRVVILSQGTIVMGKDNWSEHVKVVLDYLPSNRYLAAKAMATAQKPKAGLLCNLLWHTRKEQGKKHTVIFHV